MFSISRSQIFHGTYLRFKKYLWLSWNLNFTCILYFMESLPERGPRGQQSQRDPGGAVRLGESGSRAPWGGVGQRAGPSAWATLRQVLRNKMVIKGLYWPLPSLPLDDVIGFTFRPPFGFWEGRLGRWTIVWAVTPGWCLWRPQTTGWPAWA